MLLSGTPNNGQALVQLPPKTFWDNYPGNLLYWSKLIPLPFHDIIPRRINNHDEDNILASNKARAYFALSGYHFNPDDITRLLGIEPTSINAAGAHSGLDKPVISSWELSTETVTDEVDVYKLTDKLLKQIEPAKEKILQVIKSHNLSPRLGVVLMLSIDKDETCPDVGFGGRTTRFMADIGAFINVDYKLSERV